jgi:hypothetical protein
MSWPIKKRKWSIRKSNLMNKKLRNIASLLLLLVFLLPSIVKLEHHHKHVVYKSKNENNSQVINGKCGICDFEFYVFLSGFANIELQCEKPLINYCNNYYCIYYSNLSQFSYLLRAPPGLQIWILSSCEVFKNLYSIKEFYLFRILRILRPCIYETFS